MYNLFRQHRFSVQDGTSIGYQTAGREGAPEVLLCNGLGGNHNAYQPLMDDLADDYHFTVWDYRGLFTSAPPRRFRPPTLNAETLRVEGHARDGLELVEHVGLGRFPVIAWSMGVQVALEMYRALGDRVTGMVLLNGISGRIYDHIFGGLPGSARWIPPLLRLVKQIHPVAQGVVRTVTGWEHALDVATRLGVVHRDIDRVAAGKVLRAFGELDQELYFIQLQVLGEHDAADVLPTISCPCLVTASDRDVFTPGFATREMAAQIPRCELHSFEDGSHYAPIEYPEAINGHIARFLAREVFGGGPA